MQPIKYRQISLCAYISDIFYENRGMVYKGRKQDQDVVTHDLYVCVNDERYYRLDTTH